VSRVTFTLRAPLELLDKWRAMAEFADMSLNEFLNLWLSTSVESGQWLAERVRDAKTEPGALSNHAVAIEGEHGLEGLRNVMRASMRPVRPPLTNRGGTNTEHRGPRP
jgi:hypothetical protein